MNEKGAARSLQPLFVYLDKLFDAPVPASLDIVRKKTCRKLSLVLVIGDTLTAYPFTRTGLVCAIALFEVIFLVTLHTSIAAAAAGLILCGSRFRRSSNRDAFSDDVLRRR